MSSCWRFATGAAAKLRLRLRLRRRLREGRDGRAAGERVCSIQSPMSASSMGRGGQGVEVEMEVGRAWGECGEDRVSVNAMVHRSLSHARRSLTNNTAPTRSCSPAARDNCRTSTYLNWSDDHFSPKDTNTFGEQIFLTRLPMAMSALVRNPVQMA